MKAKSMTKKATKAMKAAGAKKALTESALIKQIANEQEMTINQVAAVLENMKEIGIHEIVKNGVFTMPGMCRIKAKTKPATTAGTVTYFGKETKVKAKPARTTVTATPTLGLKNTILEHPFALN